jgi:hypothetical protein
MLLQLTSEMSVCRCPFLNQTATIKAKLPYKFAAVCMEVVENGGFDLWFLRVVTA